MALLEINNLEYSYGQVKAVKGISMHVNEGEIVTLIGANGAGKTTAFNLITGVYTPTQGKVFFTPGRDQQAQPVEITGKKADAITKMGMADTLAPLFLPSIAAPVVFYFMLQYMEGNLPMEIVEAARIDGSGEFSTFNRIVLPILKPALAVQAIFTFVNTWNNYFTPALVLSSSGKKTLPILIAQLRSADFLKFDMGQVYMMVAIAILPVIAVYLCLSKFIVRGVALGGVKG